MLLRFGVKKDLMFISSAMEPHPPSLSKREGGRAFVILSTYVIKHFNIYFQFIFANIFYDVSLPLGEVSRGPYNSFTACLN
jgi:hypothetical protein